MFTQTDLPLEYAGLLVNVLRTFGNRVLKKIKIPNEIQLVALTALGTFLATKWISEINLSGRIKGALTALPGVNAKLQEEKSKLERQLKEKIFSQIDKNEILEEIPDLPWSTDQILERMKKVAGKIRNEQNSGAIYSSDEDIDQLCLKVFQETLRTNPMHVSLSPYVRQLEAEVVRMACSMFNGDDQTCGNITYGGTDSIFHAVYTARERAKELGINSGWEMIVPKTAHAAFEKAANALCIRLIKSEVDPESYQADVESMREAITDRTILVVGSCPGFPHGIIDPIEKISTMLQEEDCRGKIGLHVDACLGGFVLPWMSDLEGTFDFKVDRVTSISADLHKYGYAPKGTSLILYRNHADWRVHQICVSTNWPGGIYATPTLAGSRSGPLIASSWAVMAYLGKEGYKKEADQIIKTAREIVDGIRQDSYLKQHIELIGNPKAMVVAVHSKHSDVNIYDIKNEMEKKNWYLASLQDPPGFHFCVTAVHGKQKDFSEKFLFDLTESLTTVLSYPSEKKGKSGDATLYRTNTQIGASLFVPDLARIYYDILGRTKL